MQDSEEGKITIIEEEKPQRSKIFWVVILLIIVVLAVGVLIIYRWVNNLQPVKEDSYLGSLLNPPKTVHRTEDVQIKADIVQIQSMLAIYYSEHGNYPEGSKTPEPIDRILSIIENRSGATVSSGDLLYATDSTGQYYIFAKLSNKSDPLITKSGPPGILMPEGYNYWITK